MVDGEDYLFTVAIHVFDDASTFHPGIPAKSTFFGFFVGHYELRNEENGAKLDFEEICKSSRPGHDDSTFAFDANFLCSRPQERYFM